jgi:hypothetical protein
MEALFTQPQEWSGHWWRPEEPEERVPGVLYYTPQDGLRLRLIGGWSYRVSIDGGNGLTLVTTETKQWPVVLGEAAGKYISLLAAHVSSATGALFSGDAPATMDIVAQTALVGCRLDDPTAAEFTGISMTIDNLTRWSGQTGIEMKYVFPKENEVRGEVTIKLLEDLEAEVGELSVKIRHQIGAPFSEASQARLVARVREEVSLEYASDDPRPVDEWLAHIGSSADLLSLSTLSACGVTSATLYLPPQPSLYPQDHPQRNSRQRIAVFRRPSKLGDPEKKAIDHEDFILRLSDVGLERLMPRWFLVHDKFAAARNMVLSLSYVPGGYLETAVVSAVASAESFHRALGDTLLIPHAEFRVLRADLLAAVPLHRRQWLADRLTANEPSLKQRLLALHSRLGEAGLALVPDPERWAQLASHARNSLAHTGESPKLSYAHLNAVVEVTRGVVILNLLLELGLDSHHLKRAVERHRLLRRAQELAGEWLSERVSSGPSILGAIKSAPAVLEDPDDLAETADRNTPR